MYKINFQRSSQIIALVTSLSCLTLPAFAIERPNTGTLQEHKLLPMKSSTINVKVDGEQQTDSVSGGRRIKVSALRITGQNIYSEYELLPRITDAMGKELTLGELEEVAKRISKYFHDQGYFLANALIPAQDIKDGVVEITVVVGQYGKIDIRNHSTLKQDILIGNLHSLKSGEYIKRGELEWILLLINDISGIESKATLTPGIAPGTSDLIVDVNDTAPIVGQFYSDNYGNHFSGKTRVGFNVNINNLSNQGDKSSINVLTTGSGLNDYSISYLLPTGYQGAKLGVDYSHMNYLLDGEFASVNAHGIAQTIGLYETFPLNCSRNFNLNGRIGYEQKKLIDYLDASDWVSQRRSGAWNIALYGDNRDSFGGGGVNNFIFTYYHGRLDMESADSHSNDTQLQSAGSYNKGTFSLNRMQYVNKRLSLYMAVSGQLAGKNLDSSEKFYLGGGNGVRAYPQGEASGDEGYLLTGELRWSLPTPAFQLAAFIDNGRVTINKNPYNVSTNVRHLAGAGLGLIWNKQNDYSIRLDYAWKLGSDAATSDTDKNGRLWFQALKRM